MTDIFFHDFAPLFFMLSVLFGVLGFGGFFAWVFFSELDRGAPVVFWVVITTASCLAFISMTAYTAAKAQQDRAQQVVVE